ncbi:MAG: diguanylate cyclase domain-containing protein [bacterium]
MILTLLAVGLVLFALVPWAMDLEASGTETWYVIGWLVAPLWAGLATLHTSMKCDGSARRAWRNFSLASFLWMAGTITWAGYGWAGAVLPFPSLADAFYISTTFAFMTGMFHYSLKGSGGSLIQVTNFGLATCAVVAIGLFIYFPALARSEIGWLGTLIAFAYPTLWLGTLAFGLICYGLYVPERRKFPFLLIMLGGSAHAIANVFYGFDILNQSYAAGTRYDALWIAAYALVAWAALEHKPAQGHPRRPEIRTTARPVEALIPALSTAAILLAAVAAQWHHLGAYSVVLAPAVMAFAALLAFREHTLFTTERNLRAETEQSARQLAESEARLSAVLENTTDGVMVLDTEWRITFANSNAVAMMFHDRPYLGLPIWDVLSPKKGNEFYRNYCIAMEEQRPVEFEAYFAPLDVWFEDHAYPTPHDLTIFFRDVTERRRLREELLRQAQHDPLTDLANRTLFAKRLALGLRSDRRHAGLILVLIDLDGFKEVNDSLGHLAGDSLLQQFAARLTGLVRQGDTVARFGGDEFAIIQPGPVEPDGGSQVARRISEALRRPFDVKGTRVTLAASVGIAMAPEHGIRPDELVFNADLALYRAKMTKGAGVDYCIFEPGVDAHLQLPPPLRLNVHRATAKT